MALRGPEQVLQIDRLHAVSLHDQLHDRVYDAVRATIEQKRQRVIFGPWRAPTMNKFVTIGLGANGKFDDIEIIWPGGQVQKLASARIDATTVVEQGQ